VSNLLEGEITGREAGTLAVRLSDGTILRAPDEGSHGAASVRLGVRPEKLRVTAGGDGIPPTDTGLNALDGVVLDASYIGVSTQYLVRTHEGHRLTVYAQNLETSGASEALADGQQVRITWKPQHTFVIHGAAEHVPGDPHAPEGEIDE